MIKEHIIMIMLLLLSVLVGCKSDYPPLDANATFENNHLDSIILSYSNEFVKKDKNPTSTKYSVAINVLNDYGRVSFSQSSLNTYGVKATVVAEESDGNFLFWAENGKIVSKNQEFSFQITDNHLLTAYFVPKDRYAVIYLDTNETIIDFLIVEKGSNINTSKVPSKKPGYLFKGFPQITNVNEIKYIYADYQRIDKQVNVEVIDGLVKGNKELKKTFQYGSSVSVESIDEKFSYWLVNDNIVSYNPTYTFTLIGDAKIEAVLQGKTIKKLFTNLQELVLEDNTLMAIGHFDNPNNLPIVETGYLLSFSLENIDKSILGWTNAYQLRTHQISKDNEFVLLYNMESLETINICTYVKTNNGTDEKPVYITHYSEIKTYSGGTQ